MILGDVWLNWLHPSANLHPEVLGQDAMTEKIPRWNVTKTKKSQKKSEFVVQEG